MKLFADTADLKEIEYCINRGVSDGITTNPKIMELTGDLSKGFEEACKLITNKYPNIPISLETDLEGLSMREVYENPFRVRDILLNQARKLSNLEKNVVVKIPICEGGILAAEKLFKEGIKTNVTACMNPYQALRAAETGATYVSLFANRMLDSKILILSGYSLEIIQSNPEWKNIVNENKDKYFKQAWNEVISEIAYVAKKLNRTKSNLIIGSIRSPEDIYSIAKAEPQVITIPTGIVRRLKNISDIKNTKRSINDFSKIQIGNSLIHPMTHHILEEFEKSANSYRK